MLHEARQMLTIPILCCIKNLVAVLSAHTIYNTKHNLSRIPYFNLYLTFYPYSLRYPPYSARKTGLIAWVMKKPLRRNAGLIRGIYGFVKLVLVGIALGWVGKVSDRGRGRGGGCKVIRVKGVWPMKKPLVRPTSRVPQSTCCPHKHEVFCYTCIIRFFTYNVNLEMSLCFPILI